jgi:hypothetical protein
MKVHTIVRKSIWLVAAALLFSQALGFALGSRDTSRRAMLVGHWECKTEFGSWTSVRNADGTFHEEGRWAREWGKSPEPFSISGRWYLKGDTYVEIWERTNPPEWGSSKKVSSSVLSIERNKFRRLQPDSPVFEETRVKETAGKIGSSSPKTESTPGR